MQIVGFSILGIAIIISRYWIGKLWHAVNANSFALFCQRSCLCRQQRYYIHHYNVLWNKWFYVQCFMLLARWATKIALCPTILLLTTFVREHRLVMREWPLNPSVWMIYPLITVMSDVWSQQFQMWNNKYLYKTTITVLKTWLLLLYMLLFKIL